MAFFIPMPWRMAVLRVNFDASVTRRRVIVWGGGTVGLMIALFARVPAGLSETWNRARLAQETVGLLNGQGPAIRAAMITHVVPFDEAPAFLSHLLTDRPEFRQSVFEVPS